MATSDNKMRAIVYGGINSALENAVRKKPRAGRRGRVLVQVHAVGLNPVDAKDVMGDKLPHHYHWTRNRLKSFLKGKIVGLDFAGTVAEENHAGFQKGDRVFGNMPPLEGSLAEYISVPLDQVCYMPNTCSFVQAAALPLVGLTGLQSLSPYISSSKAASALIIGASGGTGHCALQIARNLGASHVTAVCSGRNVAFAKSCGATHVVDYTLDNGDADTLFRNLRQSPGWPFDVVLDCVTSADPEDSKCDYPALCQRHQLTVADITEPLVADNYKYLRLGGQSPDWIRAGVERVCCGLSLWPDKHEKLFWIRFPKSSHELKQLQEWVESGKLEVQLADTIPFTAESVQAGFDSILDRRVQGKLVVEVISSADGSPPDVS